ncbi:hypothetical protein LSO07_07700 [Janthinobacterium sp. PLB04]|uniref:Uncharacterized protein n=1 Tax=Janthinobacterium lividum TaxID=29581 RepID=A0AAJ4MVN2_9BURK|nr:MULTISPECIES: hypothetical protein [Janthinobacterium]KAB0331595.1 hypothetical protein F3B38_07780 [Janthinobacterium lividum]QSX97792.1 hypothetical protein J3P46_07690 [Janthinobacterium lividum]UGQ37749.1 hypothetical protein LSO07_07700 [Janthinobacterium sp. PLB04]
MDQYHFLVGEFTKDSPFIPAAASAQLLAWFAHIGEPVERYGSKSGKVVKFSQRNYEKTLLAPDTSSIELFSPRILPPDEADEVTNCDALAVYEPTVSLLLAMRASKLPLPQLFDGAASIPGLLDHCEYVYGYSETLGYGTGYARGYRQLDAAHPMTFGTPCPANNWAAIKRRGLQASHLRDVYPVNIFNHGKLAALPPPRLQALRQSMQAHGRSEEKHGRIHWFLSNEELDAARAALNAHAMLGAYINN